MRDRSAKVHRQTRETDIGVSLVIDGQGEHDIHTGIGMLDHVLTALAVHGLFDLQVTARGDLEIDPHHTLEDVGLVLGQAFDQALDDRAGIVRMASAYVPMDESLAFVAVDISGRPYCIFDAEWHGEMVGSLPVTLVKHFFESFANTSRMNIHARVLYGGDNHHQIEALYKALSRSLDIATALDPRRAGVLPSSKGKIV